MKIYDNALAEYIKQNNETAEILKDDAELLNGLTRYILNLVIDSRFDKNSRTIRLTMDIDGGGKLTMVAPLVTTRCDTTTSNQ